VAKAIYKKYGDDINDGKVYLEKIINIPITLPKVEPLDVLNELKRGLQTIFSQNKIDINELSNTSVHNYNTDTNKFLSEINGAEKHIRDTRMLYRMIDSFSTKVSAFIQDDKYDDLAWPEIL